MPAKPIPSSRVVLEELYRQCTLSLEKIERAVQRDLRRVQLSWQVADDEISFDELRKQVSILDDAAESARNEYMPRLESLWPYCDPSLVAS
jgi:hypothetical protein